MLSSVDGFVLESLPEHVVATMQVRDEWIRRLPRSTGGLEFFVSDVQKWRPGQHVRVAFLGGSTALHEDIARATDEITGSCNLILDFGLDAATGAYRTWSEADTEYAAEIRVSFDQGGYFSLVGTDSVDSGIGAPGRPVGGRPNQRSLNLGGFDESRPSNWQGVVRHEFLHALAFLHEHQNMRGPCEDSFRWDDDLGYEPTRNANGTFIADSQGRRPGIYTFLAGAPNFWSKPTVDHNLRTENDPNSVAGPFDARSVMLYRFPQIFYKVLPSPCAPQGEGLSLSEGDKRGLDLMYPQTGPASALIESRREALLDTIQPPAAELPGVEAAAAPLPDFASRIGGILRATRG